MKFLLRKIARAVKLILGLLLLSLACGKLINPNPDPDPDKHNTSGRAAICADTWGLYSDTGKIEKEADELFDLTLKLKDGKDITFGCNFAVSAQFKERKKETADKVSIYQWKSADNINEHYLEAERDGDILTIKNLYLYNYQHYSSERYYVGVGELTAMTLPYVQGGRPLDNSLSFVFTESRGIAGKFKFSPDKDVFVFSVENGKANSTYKVEIGGGGYEGKRRLEKEITLDRDGRGQIDFPAFSNDCDNLLLARIKGTKDRVTFDKVSYPCTKDEDSIEVDEQGRIDLVSLASPCRQPDNSVKGKATAFLSYAKYNDFPALKDIDYENLELSIDSDENVKGEVGIIPNYNSDSCLYIKLVLMMNCCKLNASYQRCEQFSWMARKVGNGC